MLFTERGIVFGGGDFNLSGKTSFNLKNKYIFVNNSITLTFNNCFFFVNYC